MADLDKLRKDWEQADERAIKLSGEYQDRVDKQVTAKWQELKERYGPRIDEANQEAAAAQQAYMDAVAAQALLDRPDGDAVVNSPAMQGDGAERLRRAYQEARS